MVAAALTGTVAAAVAGRLTAGLKPGPGDDHPAAAGPDDGHRAAAGPGASVASRASVAHFLLPAAGAVTGGAAGIWVATALATLDNPDDARLSWRFLLFLAGLAWGVTIRLVAGPAPVPTLTTTSVATDALGLKPTERAAFRTSVASPLLAGATLASAAIIAVLAATVQPWLWPVLALPVAAGLLFGKVTVTADHRGVRLVAGLVGIPVKHIPLADITAATAEDINPMEWGGWGYRMIPGRSALVLRAGPALVLDLRDGRRFAVTINQPEVPAGLLTALRTRVPN
jgi:hypothetical protein